MPTWLRWTIAEVIAIAFFFHVSSGLIFWGYLGLFNLIAPLCLPIYKER